MSSIEVANRATSTRVAVVSREPLWSGGIIAISVPIDASHGVYRNEETGEEINYLKFRRYIKGGVVNCFVHTDDLSYFGRKIVAEITVMRKTLIDERRYLYIDLRPVAEATTITRRLAIMTIELGMQLDDGWIVFETPAPLHGAIILTAPDCTGCENIS